MTQVAAVLRDAEERDVPAQGFGRRLLCTAARRFIARGMESMLLFGDANSPTNGFYEAMGGERLHGSNGEFHGGYGWGDLHKLAATCPAEQRDP